MLNHSHDPRDSCAHVECGATRGENIAGSLDFASLSKQKGYDSSLPTAALPFLRMVVATLRHTSGDEYE